VEASRARPRTGCGHRSPRRSSPRSRNRGRRRPSGPGQPTTGATTSTMNRDRTHPPPTRLRTGRGPTCPPGLGRQLRVAGIRRKLPRGGPQQRRHRLGWLTPSLDRRPLSGSRDGGPVLQLTSGSAQIFPVRRRDLPRASDRVSVGRSTRARGVAWARGCRAPSTRARRGAGRQDAHLFVGDRDGRQAWAQRRGDLVVVERVSQQQAPPRRPGTGTAGGR